MTEGSIGNPPESSLNVVLPLINRARSILERGDQLVPVAFVGNFETEKTVGHLEKPLARNFLRKLLIFIDQIFWIPGFFEVPSRVRETRKN